MANKVYTHESRAFITFKGVKYYDWKLVVFTTSDHLNNRLNNERCKCIGMDEMSRLELGTDFIDTSFLPKHDDEIYVLPGCPMAIADIRQDYKLKRKADAGVCNVYHYSHYLSHEGWIGTASEMLIMPLHKTIFISAHLWNAEQTFLVLCYEYMDSTKTQKDIDPSYIYSSKGLEVLLYSMPELHEKILMGSWQKPIITYDRLQLKRDNKLTLEQLNLVLQVGLKDYWDNGLENFKIQLAALNQYDWRDYPGTMSVFFHGIVPGLWTNQNCLGYCGRKHSLPKAVQDLIGSNSEDYRPFKSQEDVNLCKELIVSRIGKEVPEYVTYDNLLRKLAQANVPQEAFFHCYDHVVRIRPKVLKSDA